MKSFVVRALDADVRVEAPPRTCAWLHDLLRDLVVDTPDTDPSTIPAITWRSQDRDQWTIDLAGAGHMARIETAGALAETLVEINRRAAESVVADRAVLHAGTFTVAGTAVAVVGASGAGKSTTVAAAVLRGHGYLSDEVGSIDMATWCVQPYHRPIGLRAAGARAIGVGVPPPVDRYGFVYPWRPTDGARPSGKLAGSAPLGLVVFLQRRPGPVEVCAVRPAEALVRLSGVSLAAAGRERVLFRRFEKLARVIKVIEVRYDDVFGAVDAMSAALP